MSALIAYGATTDGYSVYLLIWFFLLIFGILFIALALRGDKKSQEEHDSIPNLEDLRSHPLRAVREGIRPPRPPKPTPDAAEGARPRAVHRTGGPRGLVR